MLKRLSKKYLKHNLKKFPPSSKSLLMIRKFSQTIDDHPLTNKLEQFVVQSWTELLKAKIGNLCLISCLDMQALGGIFEKILANIIQEQYPGEWRPGNKPHHEKDIVCSTDDRYSIEVKTSTNIGLKVFGNRSYANVSNIATKSRNGFTLTVNVDLKNSKICLIRFGISALTVSVLNLLFSSSLLLNPTEAI